MRLMFSHYFIVISINLVTVALELIHSGEVNSLFASGLMVTSLVVFYLSIMTNKEYYKENVILTKRDILLMVLATIVAQPHGL